MKKNFISIRLTKYTTFLETYQRLWPCDPPDVILPVVWNKQACAHRIISNNSFLLAVKFHEVNKIVANMRCVWLSSFVEDSQTHLIS